MIRRIKKIEYGKKSEIAPDEIFLDAKNLPGFDSDQFEGRFEKPISAKSVMLLGIIFIALFIVIASRAWILQIKDGAALLLESERNKLSHTLIFPERGIIYDRAGVQLAWNKKLSEKEKFFYRSYVSSPGFAHILGYVRYPARDSSGFFYRENYTGISGAERVFNKILNGENGLKIVEENALGRIVAESVIDPPKGGEDVELAIDYGLQREVFEAMSEIALERGFSGGSAVVLNIYSGEVFVMTNFPEFSLSSLSNRSEKEFKKYLEDERKPFLNRALSGLYTPGSIIKPFLAVAALEEGIITPKDQILSTGELVVENPYDPSSSTIFKDWRAHGLVDMRKALAVSSNEYFYRIGGGYGNKRGLGISGIKKYLHEFGFGAQTGIDFYGEEVGVVPDPEWKAKNFADRVWRLGDTYNTSIGQYGLSVTPMQVARAISAIANGGILPTPTLLKTARGGARRTLNFKNENLEVVRGGMRDAVLYGTAKGLLIPNIKVAAKTGTAEIGSVKKFVNSWVLGFFPYNKPKFAFAVVMEKGPAKNTIGGVAVMRKVLEWIIANRPEYVKN